MRRDVDDVIGDPQTAFNAASRRAGPESEERRTVMGTRDGPVVVIEVKQQRVKGRLCTMFQPVPQPLVGSNLRALAPDTSFGAGRVLTLGRGIVSVRIGERADEGTTTRNSSETRLSPWYHFLR